MERISSNFQRVGDSLGGCSGKSSRPKIKGSPDDRAQETDKGLIQELIRRIAGSLEQFSNVSIQQGVDRHYQAEENGGNGNPSGETSPGAGEEDGEKYRKGKKQIIVPDPDHHTRRAAQKEEQHNAPTSAGLEVQESRNGFVKANGADHQRKYPEPIPDDLPQIHH